MSLIINTLNDSVKFGKIGDKNSISDIIANLEATNGHIRNRTIEFEPIPTHGIQPSFYYDIDSMRYHSRLSYMLKLYNDNISNIIVCQKSNNLTYIDLHVRRIRANIVIGDIDNYSDLQLCWNQYLSLVLTFPVASATIRIDKYKTFAAIKSNPALESFNCHASFLHDTSKFFFDSEIRNMNKGFISCKY